MALGNFEEALEQAEAMMRLRTMDLSSRMRDFSWASVRGLSNYRAALDHYKAIISSDSGASGGAVQKARSKIEAFRRAGLYE